MTGASWSASWPSSLGTRGHPTASSRGREKARALVPLFRALTPFVRTLPRDLIVSPRPALDTTIGS